MKARSQSSSIRKERFDMEPVKIRLARPGVILPPNPSVTANFFFSPTQPREDEPVQFDGSASTGVLVSYAWTFGDGTAGTGVRPAHIYSVAGTYNVQLTVTDDRGTQAGVGRRRVAALREFALPGSGEFLGQGRVCFVACARARGLVRRSGDGGLAHCERILLAEAGSSDVTHVARLNDNSIAFRVEFV